jgi:SAM-dependent methyltransferase
LPDSAADPAYADRLMRIQGARWKRYAPNPYRWFLRKQQLGRVLELGCGVGRILGYLAPKAVGVDTNEAAIRHCRELGLEAYSPTEFAQHGREHAFDTLLVAHVLEHMSRPEAVALLQTNLSYLRDDGRVVIICPQERGFGSDATHVAFHDLDALREICAEVGLATEMARSFPLPRWFGRLFVYNEFVVIARARPT